MSDKEIIKALESCAVSDCMADCERTRCPFFIERGYNRGCGLKDEYNGKRKLYKYALDLIERQQTEITKMNSVISYLEDAYTSIADDVKPKQYKSLQKD